MEIRGKFWKFGKKIGNLEKNRKFEKNWNLVKIENFKNRWKFGENLEKFGILEKIGNLEKNWKFEKNIGKLEIDDWIIDSI